MYPCRKRHLPHHVKAHNTVDDALSVAGRPCRSNFHICTNPVLMVIIYTKKRILINGYVLVRISFV